MIKRALLLLLPALFICLPAYALEALNFKEPHSYKEKFVVNFIHQQTDTTDIPYLIAKIDLNDDFINEYIVKPNSPKFCVISSFCSYKIVALSHYKPILIGDFKAHNIVAEEGNEYGVRNLRIYGNKSNSFSFSTAYWNPFSFVYEIK